MGCIGGLSGVAFVSLNKKSPFCDPRLHMSNAAKALEAALIGTGGKSPSENIKLFFSCFVRINNGAAELEPRCRKLDDDDFFDGNFNFF